MLMFGDKAECVKFEEILNNHQNTLQSVLLHIIGDSFSSYLRTHFGDGVFPHVLRRGIDGESR